jgi:hypothetical protein
VERLLVAAELQTKALLAAMAHLADQFGAALAAAVLDKSGQTHHQMLAVMVVMVLLQLLQDHQ